jgi:hypothetical protein
MQVECDESKQHEVDSNTWKELWTKVSSKSKANNFLPICCGAISPISGTDTGKGRFELN